MEDAGTTMTTQTDCSTSTKPARDLVAYKLLGVPYKWEQDWLGGRVYVINPDLYSEKRHSH